MVEFPQKRLTFWETPPLSVKLSLEKFPKKLNGALGNLCQNFSGPWEFSLLDLHFFQKVAAARGVVFGFPSGAGNGEGRGAVFGAVWASAKGRRGRRTQIWPGTSGPDPDPPLYANLATLPGKN